MRKAEKAWRTEEGRDSEQEWLKLQQVVQAGIKGSGDTGSQKAIKMRREYLVPAALNQESRDGHALGQKKTNNFPQTAKNKPNRQNSEDKMGLWLQLRTTPGGEAGADPEAGTLKQQAQRKNQGSRNRYAT